MRPSRTVRRRLTRGAGRIRELVLAAVTCVRHRSAEWYGRLACRARKACALRGARPLRQAADRGLAEEARQGARQAWCARGLARRCRTRASCARVRASRACARASWTCARRAAHGRLPAPGCTRLAAALQARLRHRFRPAGGQPPDLSPAPARLRQARPSRTLQDLPRRSCHRARGHDARQAHARLSSPPLGVATETAVLKHLFARYLRASVSFTHRQDKQRREVDLLADTSAEPRWGPKTPAVGGAPNFSRLSFPIGTDALPASMTVRFAPLSTWRRSSTSSTSSARKARTSRTASASAPSPTTRAAPSSRTHCCRLAGRRELHRAPAAHLGRQGVDPHGGRGHRVGLRPRGCRRTTSTAATRA